MSIEPESGYASQQNTAPHHPLDEFVIDPEPLDTQFTFGAVDDPYFADDYAFDDRFEAALGSGYDDGGYDTRVGYDNDGDRIVIVDDAIAGGAATTRRPGTRAVGYPRSGPFGDNARRANPLTWLFVLAGLVLLFALVFSQCGGNDSPNGLSTNSSTTLSQVTPTAEVGASGTVATSATVPATTAAGATSGVRAPTTWVIYFAVNSTTIDSAGQQVVKEIAERLRTSAVGTPVGIAGHSDTTGNPTANQQLALTRANIVRDAIAAAVPQAEREVFDREQRRLATRGRSGQEPSRHDHGQLRARAAAERRVVSAGFDQAVVTIATGVHDVAAPVGQEEHERFMPDIESLARVELGQFDGGYRSQANGHRQRRDIGGHVVRMDELETVRAVRQHTVAHRGLLTKEVEVVREGIEIECRLVDR